jgi:Ni/Co efflux regulator RcnB
MRKYRVLLLLVLQTTQAARMADRQSLAEASREREQGRELPQVQDRERELE